MNTLERLRQVHRNRIHLRVAHPELLQLWWQLIQCIDGCVGNVEDLHTMGDWRQHVEVSQGREIQRLVLVRLLNPKIDALDGGVVGAEACRSRSHFRVRGDCMLGWVAGFKSSASVQFFYDGV